ncbi:hypothetical protein BDV98DRAFT_582869 [Pterulicium gracile]|uniref:Uncharacterized protein n=1 Tax=Pterulicium gracile TaxID=1884261 RepID=A0A5C3QM24_9AGAR|nr:hypothetical protein BDV98DRAFT_582869 [Pterula gracilis]
MAHSRSERGIVTQGDNGLGPLWKYGDWLQSYDPGADLAALYLRLILKPPTAAAPPKTLQMPDLSHLGIGPGQIFFSVIKTAENCNNPWGSSTQYAIATNRLINLQ